MKAPATTASASTFRRNRSPFMVVLSEIGGPRSARDRDRFDVSGGNRNRVAGEPVVSTRELEEVALERLAGRAFERGEGLDGRPVPRPEELDELLGGAVPEREGALRDLEPSDALAEQVAQVRLGAPEHRR